MPTVLLSQVIDRPVADVFAVVTDIESYPEWDPPVRSVTWDGQMGLGVTYEMTVDSFGAMTFEVTEYEVDRVVRAEPRHKRFSGGHRLTFSEDDQMTRIDHEFVIEPKGLLRLLSPVFGIMARRGLKGSTEGLKDFCERR
jgi:uncharacterized protein YndB with AHSA1/START domain